MINMVLKLTCTHNRLLFSLQCAEVFLYHNKKSCMGPTDTITAQGASQQEGRG